MILNGDSNANQTHCPKFTLNQEKPSKFQFNFPDYLRGFFFDIFLASDKVLAMLGSWIGTCTVFFIHIYFRTMCLVCIATSIQDQHLDNLCFASPLAPTPNAKVGTISWNQILHSINNSYFHTQPTRPMRPMRPAGYWHKD